MISDTLPPLLSLLGASPTVFARGASPEAIPFGDAVSLLSPAEEKLGREINSVVYPIAEFKQKVRDDHRFVKTVLDSENIFLIGDEAELVMIGSSDLRGLISSRYGVVNNLDN